MSRIPDRTTDLFIATIDLMHSLDPVEKPPGAENLSPGTILVVEYLSEHSGCRIQNIADDLKLSKPTVSITISKLENDGICRREGDARDGRAFNIYLTTAGSTLAAGLRAFRRTRAHRLFGSLTEDEHTQMQALFARILNTKENAE